MFHFFRYGYDQKRVPYAVNPVRWTQMVLCVSCLALAIYIIISFTNMADPSKIIPAVAATMFVLVTLADIFANCYMNPINWQTWIFLAIAGTLTFFLGAGFLIASTLSSTIIFMITILFYVVTGIVFLIDVLILLFFFRKRDWSVYPDDDLPPDNRYKPYEKERMKEEAKLKTKDGESKPGTVISDRQMTTNTVILPGGEKTKRDGRQGRDADDDKMTKAGKGKHQQDDRLSPKDISKIGKDQMRSGGYGRDDSKDRKGKTRGDGGHGWEDGKDGRGKTRGEGGHGWADGRDGRGKTRGEGGYGWDDSKDGRGKTRGEGGHGRDDGKDGRGKTRGEGGHGWDDSKDGRGKTRGESGHGWDDGRDGKGKTIGPDGQAWDDSKDGRGKSRGVGGHGWDDGRDGKGKTIGPDGQVWDDSKDGRGKSRGAGGHGWDDSKDSRGKTIGPDGQVWDDSKDGGGKTRGVGGHGWDDGRGKIRGDGGEAWADGRDGRGKLRGDGREWDDDDDEMTRAGRGKMRGDDGQEWDDRDTRDTSSIQYSDDDQSWDEKGQLRDGKMWSGKRTRGADGTSYDDDKAWSLQVGAGSYDESSIDGGSENWRDTREDRERRAKMAKGDRGQWIVPKSDTQPLGVKCECGPLKNRVVNNLSTKSLESSQLITTDTSPSTSSECPCSPKRRSISYGGTFPMGRNAAPLPSPEVASNPFKSPSERKRSLIKTGSSQTLLAGSAIKLQKDKDGNMTLADGTPLLVVPIPGGDYGYKDPKGIIYTKEGIPIAPDKTKMDLIKQELKHEMASHGVIYRDGEWYTQDGRKIPPVNTNATGSLVTSKGSPLKELQTGRNLLYVDSEGFLYTPDGIPYGYNTAYLTDISHYFEGEIKGVKTQAQSRQRFEQKPRDIIHGLGPQRSLEIFRSKEVIRTQEISSLENFPSNVTVTKNCQLFMSDGTALSEVRSASGTLMYATPDGELFNAEGEAVEQKKTPCLECKKDTRKQIVCRSAPANMKPDNVCRTVSTSARTVAKQKPTSAPTAQSNKCQETCQNSSSVGITYQCQQQQPQVLYQQYLQRPCHCGKTHYQQVSTVHGTVTATTCPFYISSPEPEKKIPQTTSQPSNNELSRLETITELETEVDSSSERKSSTPRSEDSANLSQVKSSDRKISKNRSQKSVGNDSVQTSETRMIKASDLLKMHSSNK